MEHPLLDTSVFSTYKKLIDENIDSFHFSTVVLYELIASLIDESTMQKYQSWETAFRKTDKLITPTRTDWIIAAKSVRRLRHQNLIDKNLSPTALQNDALIARSSFMHKCFVVTDNIRDYALLQKVMPKLEVIPAGEFFN
jgi:predicted nucleic acid-binding protein